MKPVKSKFGLLYRAYKEHKIHKRHARVIARVASSSGRSRDAAVSAAAVGKVWGPYTKVDPVWAQVYAQINDIASPYYFPSDIWRILLIRMRRDNPAHNNQPDKNYTDIFFRDCVKLPGTVFRCVGGTLLDADYKMIGWEEAIRLCVGYGELVMKPSVDSQGGSNVFFIKRTASAEDFAVEIKRTAQKLGRNYIVQLPLKQHPAMSAMNPDSVNTVRMLTLLWKGEIRIIGSLVRVGVKGVRIDNPHTSNGVSCVIDEEGFLNKTAYDRDWRPHLELPSGLVCEGLRVPNIKAIREKVTELHQRIPYIHIVGWDMVVSEDGEPAMIEVNTGAPEIYFHQIAAGPIFEPELFRDIMDTYFKK